jgi:hypothetical protein
MLAFPGQRGLDDVAGGINAARDASAEGGVVAGGGIVAESRAGSR